MQPVPARIHPMRLSQKSDIEKGRGQKAPPPLIWTGFVRLRELRPVADSAQAETGNCGDAQCDQQADQAG